MSTLKLYQTEIVPSRNALVDNIEDYLASLPVIYETDKLQHQQIQSELEIKLPRDQSKVSWSDCNYAVLRQDERTYYFFIMAAKWTAKKTVSYLLSMDTINTFDDELDWSPNTQIIREHEDRFYNVPEHPRKIDFYDEGLETVCDVLEDEYTFIDQEDHQLGDFYLIYRTRSGITPESTKYPMSVDLCADEPITVQPATSGPIVKLYASSIEKDEMIFVSGSNLKNANLHLEGTGTTFNLGPVEDGKVRRVFVISRHLATGAGEQPGFKVDALDYTGSEYPYSFARRKTLMDVAGSQTLPNAFSLNNIRAYSKVKKTDFYETLTSLRVIDGLPETVVNSGNIPALQTISFNAVDRGDVNISKIVQLPYCPINLYETGSIKLPDGWIYDEGYKMLEMPLRDNRPFKRDLGERQEDFGMISGEITATGQEDRNDYYESKLWHSSFYQPRYLYQDVVIPIRLEAFNMEFGKDDIACYPEITYSSNMSSSALINLGFSRNYTENRMNELKAISTVNTELPIYNSEYVNYLKNGYNFDLASKERQNKMATINAALSGVGSAIGLGVGLGSGINSAINQIAANKYKARQQSALPNSEAINEALTNIPMRTPQQLERYSRIALNEAQMEKIGGEIEASALYPQGGIGITLAGSVASQGLSTVGNVVNAVMSIENNNRQFAQSLRQQQVAGVSATGLNDSQLINDYNYDRLGLQLWTLREPVRKAIADVFYFTGYIHPEKGHPNTSSRYWFNFIQCDPVFVGQNTQIYTPYLEDIKSRYQAGITVYHSHNGQYDWDQTKENWETWLVK